LTDNDFLVVASALPLLPADHERTADLVHADFFGAYQKALLNGISTTKPQIPIIGLSHSLGGKLTALISSDLSKRKSTPKRRANIYMAFNNYGAQESMDNVRSLADKYLTQIKSQVDSARGMDYLRSSLEGSLGAVATTWDKGSILSQTEGIAKYLREAVFSDQIPPGLRELGAPPEVARLLGQSYQQLLDSAAVVEFTPSPEETWRRMLAGYNVQRNQFIRFEDDPLDQSDEAAAVLRDRGCDAGVTVLPGNHLTPNMGTMDGILGADSGMLSAQLLRILDSVCKACE
jgi:hypothetical protein